MFKVAIVQAWCPATFEVTGEFCEQNDTLRTPWLCVLLSRHVAFSALIPSAHWNPHFWLLSQTVLNQPWYNSLSETGIKSRIGVFNFLTQQCSIHFLLSSHSPSRIIFDSTCSCLMLNLPTADQTAEFLSNDPKFLANHRRHRNVTWPA